MTLIESLTSGRINPTHPDCPITLERASVFVAVRSESELPAAIERQRTGVVDYAAPHDHAMFLRWNDQVPAEVGNDATAIAVSVCDPDARVPAWNGIGCIVKWGRGELTETPRGVVSPDEFHAMRSMGIEDA